MSKHTYGRSTSTEDTFRVGISLKGWAFRKTMWPGGGTLHIGNRPGGAHSNMANRPGGAHFTRRTGPGVRSSPTFSADPRDARGVCTVKVERRIRVTYMERERGLCCKNVFLEGVKFIDICTHVFVMMSGVISQLIL